MVEHNQSQYYGNQYKFNGKELDSTTGMYYYGARYYEPRFSIFVSVDPLVEMTMEPYSYVGNNPIMFTDPTGMSKDGIDTKYKRSDGRTLLNTKDGSNDVIIVPDNMVDDFKHYNASYQNGNKVLYDSQSWNESMKSDILGFESSDEMNNTLGVYTTQWSRQNAIDYRQNPTISNFAAMSFSEAGSQWSDPEKLVMAASIFVGGINPKGLGNKFKNKTMKQVEKAFGKHVKNGNLINKPSAPGNKAYQRTGKSKYSYNLDPGGVYKKGIERAHIDVNYPNPKPKNVPSKKKLSIK